MSRPRDAGFLLLVALVFPMSAKALPLSTPAVSGPTDPDRHVRAAIDFLRHPPRGYDCGCIRFFSFWDTEEAELFNQRRYLAWAVNQMSFQRATRVPLDVPQTGGRLVWVDLRWYGWNSRAWQAVARRDPFAREPWITHTNAEASRKLLGYEKEQPVKGTDGLETIPLITFVNAEWFIRETMETQRGNVASTSYYDLLYARFRFPESAAPASVAATEEYEAEETFYFPGGPDKEGKYFPPGNYKRKVKKTRPVANTAKASNYEPFVDFPATVADLEKAVGVDKVRAFARETEIDLDFGAVVAGGADDDKKGSIVALNNRLIVIIPTPWGWYMRTYDVFETTGDRDFSEKLIFKKGHFRKGDGADAVFDAGEILFSLPNGGQGSFLHNAQEKRAEFAAQQAAQDSSNKRLNLGVVSGCAGRCVVCHGATGGVIIPHDQEKEDREQHHIKRRFRDKEQEQRYRDFFSDWEDDAKYITSRYERMIRQTTVHPALYGEKEYDGVALPLTHYSGNVFGKPSVLDTIKDIAPWTGSKIAAETDRQRLLYDGMVSPERAARKLGVPADLFKRLCVKGGVTEDGRVRNHRLNQFVQGKSIPSRTFEVDVFRKAGFLLDAYRNDPEYQGGKK